MSEMLWASTSCSSWAMRSRSSLARLRASSARAAAAWADRSSRLRISSVPTASTSSHAPMPAAAPQSGQASSWVSGEIQAVITHPATRLAHARRLRPRITALT